MNRIFLFKKLQKFLFLKIGTQTKIQEFIARSIRRNNIRQLIA